MTKKQSELGEGLFWMGEKLAWGYEGSTPDLAEAYRLFIQAAELGVSDAWIRIGELLEHGKGVQRDPKRAMNAYQRAIKAGNFYGLAFAARLVSRGPALEEADQLWYNFFKAFSLRPELEFKSASRGELLHSYIETQLRIGLEPQHLKALKRYRLEIAGHHQRLLEHITDGERLERLDGVFLWIEFKFGPWPVENHA